MKVSLKNGGVQRSLEWGLLDVSKGVPPSEDRALSLMGWGTPDALKRAGVGAQGTDVPQVWLCNHSEAFPPVWSRWSASGTETRLIQQMGQTIGICYEDENAEYCLLTGVLPEDLTASRVDQTTSVFEGIEKALKEADMTFSDVARTWLYMDKILEWYDPFNRARDAFFVSRGVYEGRIPASTGIGSANLYGAAITACAIAVKPKHGLTTIQPVDSPLQCSALRYRSSFSRAMEIGTPDCRTLLISGTASIEPGGATAHVDDVEKQIQLTMDVVEAILVSRDMSWADTTRAIMYLKKPEYLPVWHAWLEKNKLTAMPLMTLEADVCRDDLLVELELDAIKKRA
jgi:enamine deaminase RidA (YjgF/YER057c/UK114 family)